MSDKISYGSEDTVDTGGVQIVLKTLINTHTYRALETMMLLSEASGFKGCE